jgi:hypothetical protein
MGDGKVQHPPPLHVKADDASPAPTGRRRSSVRIGQRYLFIRGGAQDGARFLNAAICSPSAAILCFSEWGNAARVERGTNVFLLQETEDQSRPSD